MSNVRTRNSPEKPQQELRFTASDPVLDEALAMLERDGEMHRQRILDAPSERHPSFLPKSLFLFAMNRISIDTSDTFEGVSQNYSAFGQYREAIKSISRQGQKYFKLDPWLKELRSGGPNGALVGIGLRLRIDPLDVDTIIAPPFLGTTQSLNGLSIEQRERVVASNATLKLAREVQYIPVRYEIGRTVEDPQEALERLRAVVELGVTASQLVVVPSYPRAARQAHIYHDMNMPARTYGRVDEYIAHELVDESISRDDPDDEMKNAS